MEYAAALKTNQKEEVYANIHKKVGTLPIFVIYFAAYLINKPMVHISDIP